VKKAFWYSLEAVETCTTCEKSLDNSRATDRGCSPPVTSKTKKKGDDKMNKVENYTQKHEQLTREILTEYIYGKFMDASRYSRYKSIDHIPDEIRIMAFVEFAGLRKPAETATQQQEQLHRLEEMLEIFKSI